MQKSGYAGSHTDFVVVVVVATVVVVVGGGGMIGSRPRPGLGNWPSDRVDKEMAQHAQFSIDTGVDVYFCDPKSPWQRGSNENSNGLLRQYFPKGTDMSKLTQDALDRAAHSLNGRPRQTLNWKTPSDKLAETLQ
jgi:hypothetical protein